MWLNGRKIGKNKPSAERTLQFKSHAKPAKKIGQANKKQQFAARRMAKSPRVEPSWK